jgi:VanZ family protein
MSSKQLAQHYAPGTRETLVVWGFVLAWMGVIFVLSAQGSLGDMQLPPIFRVLRKCAHVVEYWILAVLVGRALLHTWRLQGEPLGRALLVRVWWVGAALATLYAISDELHQALVLKRHGQPGDVLVDALAATAGLGIWYIVRERELRSRNR